MALKWIFFSQNKRKKGLLESSKQENIFHELKYYKANLYYKAKIFQKREFTLYTLNNNESISSKLK
jgi:hypothetical protein